MALKRLSALAVAALMANTAPAADQTNMTEAERQAFRAEVRAYLLENPEVLMEAIAVLENREAEAQASADVNLVRQNSDALFNDPNDWVGGNPDGDVVMVEFLDYRCSYCRRAHDEVAELLETDGNIKIIVKEFPILGEESILASRFAIATLQQIGSDAYKKVTDELMTMRGQVSNGNLRKIADELELDADVIMGAMDAEEVTAVIAANHALGRDMQINGTPTFVVGEQLLRGYLPLEGMRGVVADVRTN
ncbi:DsbA family protein [Actibacterium pelagium]|uniref:DSBA oxidoreductase n=1 Tax=Actibacterium pelagium TaxID=2029103 RepID=A0A917ADM5_9RHOB|nr:DsbA family protein [Actibacterium pelagium]GGE45312.1 DSBA oxidoreductase [Actibacterium pelagium]